MAKRLQRQTTVIENAKISLTIINEMKSLDFDQENKGNQKKGKKALKINYQSRIYIYGIVIW